MLGIESLTFGVACIVLEVEGSTGYRLFFLLSLGGIMQRVLDPEKLPKHCLQLV